MSKGLIRNDLGSSCSKNFGSRLDVELCMFRRYLQVWRLRVGKLFDNNLRQQEVRPAKPLEQEDNTEIISKTLKKIIYE